jgi:hypothetical protein
MGWNEIVEILKPCTYQCEGITTVTREICSRDQGWPRLRWQVTIGRESVVEQSIWKVGGDDVCELDKRYWSGDDERLLREPSIRDDKKHNLVDRGPTIG